MTPKDLRRGGWRMMAGSLRPSWYWILIGVAASLSWAAGKVTVPYLAQRAIDAIGSGRVALWPVAIVATTLVVTIATGLRYYSAFRISIRAETDLRARLFAHLQRLHFAFHDQAETGQLMSRANSDLRQIQFLLVFIPVSGANLVMMAGVATVLFRTNATLAAVSLVSLPFLNVAATRFSRRLHPQSTDLQQRLADLSRIVEETISGIRVVKGFGAEEMQRSRLRVAASGVFDRAMSMARLRANFTPLMELLPTVGLVAVLYVGGREVLAGRLTVGELVAFNFYILQLVFPLRITANIVAAASRASASAARVWEVLATAPVITDRPHSRNLPSGPGDVVFDRVTFGYTPGYPVLTDFTMKIKGGESVALVGPTGCGKSTVARLLARFYDVDGGRVRIDGADVRDVRLPEIRRAVSIVFEDTFLFSDTVRANIALARHDASLEDVHAAAKLAGAHDFITALPDGYDTVLGEQGFSLSGGQRQRIAVARAVLADPRVLVLDDATSSVDPEKEHEIRDALATVAEGRTLVVIAHRPATIALADRVVLLDRGRIVAEGTHDELLRTSERYRDVLAHAGGYGGGARSADPPSQSSLFGPSPSSKAVPS